MQASTGLKLEIVSHCWRYSRLLNYQLSSFVLHPPQEISVLCTVFCAPAADDPETGSVLDFFERQMLHANVTFRRIVLVPCRLLRRAIGRNLAALTSEAEWLWFADCDMCFGSGCLDGLKRELADRSDPLLYPRWVLQHRTHQLGDAAIERVDKPCVIDIRPDEFKRHRYDRAIGGAQIVEGATARRVGYCPNGRHQRWTDGDRWAPNSDDRSFRLSLGTRGVPITIPQVYRIRHSRRGQDCPGVRL